MRAIFSTLHLKVKYLSEGGGGEVRELVRS